MLTKLKIFILALATLCPLYAQACPYIQQPYHMMDKHDLLITAEATDCKKIDGLDYVNLSVRNVWKGKKQEHYTIQESCSKPHPTFTKGDRYMLVANYTNDDNLIEIPRNEDGMWCEERIIRSDYRYFSPIENVLNSFKYGYHDYLLQNIPEMLFTSGDPNFGLGEPIYVFHSDLFSYKTHFYFSLVVSFLLLTTIVLSLLAIPYFLITFLRRKL